MDFHLRIPWHGHFMWPFAVAMLGFKYFVTFFAVRFGQLVMKPHRIAFINMDMRGLHRDWWANHMLFAFVRMV